MPAVNPALYRTEAWIERTITTSDNAGGWREERKRVGRIRCRIGEPQLVQRTDQQGRLGSDLVRVLHCPAGSDIRTGDRVRVVGQPVLIVEGTADQPEGAYRKALVVEEAI